MGSSPNSNLKTYVENLDNMATREATLFPPNQTLVRKKKKQFNAQ
jgi:hypothetical protein